MNGSLRPALEIMRPAEYFGVDLEMGRGVDAICDIGELVSRYGANRWDVVVCTEMLEHVADWRIAASNLKRALAHGGHLLLTTRSLGFPYHAHPVDFWRFETIDICRIFGDLRIATVKSDPETPGVFLHAIRGDSGGVGRNEGVDEALAERDLSDYAVHSMLANRRITHITESLIHQFIAGLRAQRERLQMLENAHLSTLERMYPRAGYRS